VTAKQKGEGQVPKKKPTKEGIEGKPTWGRKIKRDRKKNQRSSDGERLRGAIKVKEKRAKELHWGGK